MYTIYSISLTKDEKHFMTATKNRHRISTLYAAQDIPSIERNYFYDHMGHSDIINKTVYQNPAALREILCVGKTLISIDPGE